MYKKFLQWAFGKMPKELVAAICAAFFVALLYSIMEAVNSANYGGFRGLNSKMAEAQAENAIAKIIIFFSLFWISIDGYKLRRNQSTPNPDTHVKCPDCRELVHKEASKCPHCGCKLIPSP